MDVGTKSYTSHQEAKMTATVERIESWIVDVPTIRPHKLSMTTMGCQTLVIVRLTRSDGICGIGEATTIGGLSYGVESPEAISSAITHYLTPLLLGQPADNLNALTARMNSAIKGNTLPSPPLKPRCWMPRAKRWGCRCRRCSAARCKRRCRCCGR
jgi:muconate cycloisomerase